MRVFFGFDIAPSARIGLSFILTSNLSMGEGAMIGNFNVIKNLESLVMGECATIGQGNWISGYMGARHYSDEVSRRSEFLLAPHSAITNRHIIDCTNTVSIGEFTILAGYGTQILTHSIDLKRNNQTSSPVVIGSYCFVGTDCCLLSGTALPDRSVLSAKSLLNSKLEDVGCIYGGVPARRIKLIDSESLFFKRNIGFVN